MRLSKLQELARVSAKDSLELRASLEAWAEAAIFGKAVRRAVKEGDTVRFERVDDVPEGCEYIRCGGVNVERIRWEL